MLSSTSSSSFRLPELRWRFLWMAISALVFTVLLTWELFLRSQGYTAAVSDDPSLWATTRSLLQPHDREAFAVVGASRVQQGIHLDSFPQGKPAQLAISGASPVPLLEHLADDPSFVGTVIVDVTPRILFERDEDGGAGLRLWIERMMASYQRQQINGDAWYAGWERELKVLLQQTFVSAGQNASPRRLLRGIVKGETPQAPHWWVRPDRMQLADYSKIDLEGFRKSREHLTEKVGEALAPEEVAGRVERLRKLADRIEARGGRVVFVRMPSSGQLREIEERRFPREQYWDVLAAGVDAPAFHFEDHAELSGYDCPDGSHLSYEDSAQFTQALIRMLDEMLKR